ncbi:hypothetical protein [Mongoliitalea daihaiensis]|uniref:hypothetical protein n=1 Tax=Mongoliitalea daihaiensis TaxID=2782006 RepID=UPI001F284E2B|nr:hypothetical protein [Mongoliitalea daihaiensis]UJP64800.1 hypothetical protein IPZ59_18725 [Mongoliitalea daihaiensis]
MNDQDFQSIKNLKWLPWIGSDFFNLPLDKRILIVGVNGMNIYKEKFLLNLNG